MGTDLPQPARIRTTFYNVVVMHYDFDYTTLQLIAEMAGVDIRIMDRMFTSVAIRRSDAEKLLATFSEYTQESWTLDNVKVALYPTFADLYTLHQLDLDTLSTHSEIARTVIDKMLCDVPVAEREAHLVLQVVSRLSQQTYTLDTVDVKLAEVTDE
jgi:hypothetical protein